MFSTRVIRASKRPTREVQCQTVGLFYPGAKKITQEQQLMEELRAQELRMRDKMPPLNAISPGRGAIFFYSYGCHIKCVKVLMIVSLKKSIVK